ncbi:MAG TPA: DUF6600 domain-containing protein, partial [Bacteroidales bacterium]|nr:DUF6600 domain-containing protein [Bacteroidales bacterium]
GYEWGWAPFHYGRWDYDDYYGWFWFPDDQWGPAWVTWRQGDGYYGWAPMGPGTNFGRGMDNLYNDPYRWIFIRDRDFGKGNIVRYNVNPRRNMEILRSSQVINNVVSDNTGRAVYSAGPDPLDVQRSTGRRVTRYEIRDSDRPGTRLNSNQVQMYRPRISANADAGNRPAPSRITDIKDLRPLRERNRNYQPSESSGGMREYTPDVNQGRRQESDSEERARETRRQYEQKQYEMERRKLESEEEQQQRSREIRENRPVLKSRQESERKQQTDQQKRILRREREVRRENAADTARSRKVEREATSRPRRK